MSWLAYALATVVLWTAWSFLGVIALKDVSPALATLVFGIAVVIVGVASLVLGSRSGSGSPWPLPWPRPAAPAARLGWRPSTSPSQNRR